MSDKDEDSDGSVERNANLITFEFAQLSSTKKSKIVPLDHDAYNVKNIIFPSVDFVDSPQLKKRESGGNLGNSPTRSMTM